MSDKATSCPKCGHPMDKVQQPYQYKYYYKPKKYRGCIGCLIAFVVIVLLGVLCIGGLVYGCVDYGFNLISTTNTSSFNIIDGFIDDFSDEYYDETDDYVELDSLVVVEEQDDMLVLHGYIEGISYPITMILSLDLCGDVTGRYYYDTHGEESSVGITGNYQAPYLTLYENNVQDNNQAAYFEGKFDMGTFSGSYTNSAQQEYAFNLIVKD